MNPERTCPCGAKHRRKHARCTRCHAAYMREWRKTHPLTAEQKRKDNCRSYAGVYLRRGKITRQPCTDCGATPEDDKILMHWEDYDKPLDITWLCNPCLQDRLHPEHEHA